MGAGLVVRAIGRHEANQAEAEIEAANASYYREQAQFAEDAGKRAQLIFDRESIILLSEQESAISKADLGAETAAAFLGAESVYRQQERFAIGQEYDASARLAMLRAGAADARVGALTDSSTQVMGILGDALSIGSDIAIRGGFSKTGTPSTTGSVASALPGVSSTGQSYTNYSNRA